MSKTPNSNKVDTSAGTRGYSGKIPTAAIIALEWELAKLEHGTANLTIHIRDGRLARFTTGRERSHMGCGNDE
jgi:hypothetical protein